MLVLLAAAQGLLAQTISDIPPARTPLSMPTEMPLTLPIFDPLLTITPAARPSNVVVIMVDDLDARSLDDLLGAGLMPNLATHVIERGVDFEDAYVSTPLCCPSRATFLTGQYPHNTGIVSNGVLYPGEGIQWGVSMFDDSVTIATRLQAVGYTTGHIGSI